LIARALLALAAYSPVAILTGIRISRSGPAEIVIGVGVLAALALFVALGRARWVSAPTPVELMAVEDKSADVPAYMMGYLLPFVMVTDPSARDLIVLGAFGVVLLLVSARSTVLTVNPLLQLVGLRVYEAAIDAGHGSRDTVTLLARRRPLPVADVGADVRYAPVTGRLVASGIYLIGRA
jgi:hypothetical protein